MPREAAERIRAQFAAQIPMQRLGTPAEFATAALFLAFDATYPTGAELVVDGGGTSSESVLQRYSGGVPPPLPAAE